MASNKELAARALELGRVLGEGVETKGLNNAKLTELVATLEARLPAKPAASDAEVTGAATTETATAVVDGEQPKAQAPAEQPKAKVPAGPPVKPPETKAPVFRVAPGKAVLTLSREVQGPDAEVTAADFQQGALRLEQLLAAGYLVKR